MKPVQANLTSLETRIAQLINLKARYVASVDLLNDLLPSLEAGFKAAGLQISQIGHSKTGWSQDVWEDQDSLRVSIEAVPLTEKSFRFIAHNGYTARGEGRNQAALEAKAEKLAKTIGHGAQVNQFSLESKGGKTSRVLVTLWVSISACEEPAKAVCPFCNQKIGLIGGKLVNHSEADSLRDCCGEGYVATPEAK